MLDYHELGSCMLRMLYQFSDQLYTFSDCVHARGADVALDWLEMSDKPLSAGELAEKMKLTTGRITAIIHTLEKRGHVHHIQDPSDRRRTLISITEEGIEYRLQERKKAEEMYANVLEKLSIEEANELLRLMGKLLQ